MLFPEIPGFFFRAWRIVGEAKMVVERLHVTDGQKRTVSIIKAR